MTPPRAPGDAGAPPPPPRPELDPLLRAERVADAEQRFTEAAAAAPNAEAHFYLGVLHERRKAFDPAAQEYRRAIAVAPDMAEAHDRLGFTLGLQAGQSRRLPASSGPSRSVRTWSTPNTISA